MKKNDHWHRHYVRTHREKVGSCNICGKVEELTWDHVPPQGGINITRVDMQTIFHTFVGNREERKVRESQNGMKYRTICWECNNLLGNTYDPIINEFALSVGRYLKSRFTFPQTVMHRTKPGALIRGVLGHLLAAKIDADQCNFDSMVRELVLNPAQALPDNLHIFYWLYPYEQTMIMRDFAMPAIRGNFSRESGIGFFHALKYFPIAYLVSDISQYEGLPELTALHNADIHCEIEIPIQLNRVEHPFWPEMVDDGNLLFGGQSLSNSVFAKPRNNCK